MLEKAKADPKTRQLIEERENAARNYASAIADAKFEGIEEGEKIGIEKGEKIGLEKGKAEERAKAYTEKIEIAKKLILTGLNIEQVSQITNLSIDEVLRLTS